MTLGEESPTDATIIHQRRSIHAFNGDRTLHISKLADVVIALVHGRPAEERIADGLQRLLVFDDTLSLMRVPSRVAVDECCHTRAS